MMSVMSEQCSEQGGRRPGRRVRCERCQRPFSHCLCAHIPFIETRTRVLVLQHPDEARHPLNTARLAVLGLRNSEMWVGEHFPELEAQIALYPSAILLFPKREGDVRLLGDSRARLEELDRSESAPASCGRRLLIVPDGTWRKARRLVQINPVLEPLSRLSLPEGDPSEYRVRKAREAGAVSTIEAIVRALSLLEPAADLQSLLTPFNVMIEQQIKAMGDEVYRRNHSPRSL